MPKPQARLITNQTNIRYLSNFTGSAGFMLLTKNKIYLFTDSRYIERAKSTIKKDIEIVDITRVWRNPQMIQEHWQKILKKHQIKTLGIEESDLTITKFKKFKKISPKIRFTDISGEIEEKRQIKTSAEIKLIKKSQDINEKVFLEIKKIIQTKTGLTEIELAWRIKELGHKFGAEDVSFDPIVAFGKHSAIPHHSPTDIKLKNREIVLIDMGMKYQGYCSDMTRMVFKGNPTAKQAEIYDLVLKAQETAITGIKEGITGKKADTLAREVITKAGYGENYGHAGGHGIGLDIHEIPSLAEGYIKKLHSNTVVTIEPGIYLPGQFGVRIEDMVLVTKTGNQNLTKITKYC